MDENREEELLKLLRYIAAGIDRIGAALTIQASESVKDEVIGSSEISSDTQAELFTVEAIRNKALKVLAKTYRKRK
ncbi:MAG: hypothetical protein ACYTGV_05835 [Planctomycetota bacterium]|jgi:hypothetical protein